MRFQSQTGSQALSDMERAVGLPETRRRFQSQTGSQALSDLMTAMAAAQFDSVSIPNGKPGPLRRPDVG